MTARSTPTPEMRRIFAEVAKRRGVPNTLLMAIARVETGFDEAYAAPPPSTSRGMFRATDEMRAAVAGYMPENASELERQITLASAFLATYLDSALWSGNRPGAVMSFYFAKASLGPYDSAIEAGAGRASQLSAAGTEGWPPGAAAYLEAVKLARRQLQQEGKVSGSSRIEKLRNAFVALKNANGPEWAAAKLGAEPSIVLDDQLKFAEEWYGWSQQPLDLLLPSPSVENLHQLWTYYDAFFEMAPITDATTPAPWVIEPKLAPLPGVVKAFDRTFSDAAAYVASKVYEGKEATKEAFDKLNNLGFGEAFGSAMRTVGWATLALVAGLGTVYIFANRRRT